MTRTVIIGFLCIIIAGCGGNDEFGLTAPSVTQNDIYGVWFQCTILDGWQPKYEKYDTSGLFVHIEQGKRDTGTFRFLNNLNIELTLSSSEYYNIGSQLWIKNDLSNYTPDTINFHLNAGGFWVRGFESPDDIRVYAREWYKVDSLPFLGP